MCKCRHSVDVQHGSDQAHLLYKITGWGIIQVEIFFALSIESFTSVFVFFMKKFFLSSATKKNMEKGCKQITFTSNIDSHKMISYKTHRSTGIVASKL
jgi:hypothetical protein